MSARPKCLRCGAGPEWIEGKVPAEAKLTHSRGRQWWSGKKNMNEPKNDERTVTPAVAVQRLVSPLFVYLKSCKIEKFMIKRVEAAGYIPIAVESFDDFKIIETLPIGATNEITKAALREIVSGYSSAAESFGRKVAKTLAG